MSTGITPTNDLLRRAIQIACGGKWTPEPGQLHLFGIQAATPQEGRLCPVPNTLNAWDDTIGTFGTEIALYRGTVDPGRDYTLHPTNSDGCAHLVPLEFGGEPYHFGPGFHQASKYGDRFPCLVEYDEVLVRRDRNRDGAIGPGEKLYRGRFGIHIHAGDGLFVGPWSAGCQVIHGGWVGAPWQAFLKQTARSGQGSFRYWLFTAETLRRASL